MHLKPAGALLVLLLAALLTGAYSCRQPQKTYYDSKSVTAIIEATSAIEDTMDYSRAIAFVDRSIAGKPLSPDDEYRVYKLKGYIYQNKLLDHTRASLYADSMLLVATQNKLDNAAGVFNAYKLKADAQYALGAYKCAYETYENARQIADTTSSPYIKSRYLFGLAMAFYKEERYLEAARYFTEAFDKSKSGAIVDAEYLDFFRQEILGNAGLAYSMGDKADSGMYYYRQAIIFQQQKQPLYPAKVNSWEEAASVVYGNMAGLYKKMGARDSAETYFIKSIAVSKHSGRNLKDRAYNMLKLADLYIDARAYDKAHALLDEAGASMHIDSGNRVNPTDSLELVYRYTGVLSKYYESTGNHELAFTYLQKHHDAQERKWAITQKRVMNNVEVGIRNAGWAKQINFLEKDNKIRNQRIAILILICLVSISGIAIVFYNMRLHKMNSARLSEQNKQILSESSIIQKEMQHKIDTDRANYLALLENTDDCLWSLDKDLNILAFNKIYREFIQLVSGEVPRVGQEDMLKDIDQAFYANILTGYQTALAGNTFTSVDKGIKTGSANLDFAMRFNPVKNNSGDVIGITCSRKDITEYFSLTDSLRKNTEQFKNIAWIQSHALRGPLTTIMGIALVLSDQQGDEDVTINKELIKGMMQKLEEMDKIVKEIVKLTY